MARETIEALQSENNDWQGFRYSLLAELLASAGLLNGACSYWEYYISRYPSESQFGPTQSDYGNTLFALGRFEKAIDHFSAMYARSPDMVLMLGTRAMVYSRTGQYKKAEEDLAELAKTFPRNFPQFYDLYWRRELDAATSYFEWMEGQKNLQPLFKIWGCFLLGHIERGMQYLEAANFPPFQLRVLVMYALTPTIRREVTSHPKYQALLRAHDTAEDWNDHMLQLAASVEHITGIHVSPDEDY
jgi:tetratricopeptide (TPR) repeat protein